MNPPPSPTDAHDTAAAPRTYRVAFEGFSSFERSTLAAFFRLAAGRAPRYDLAPGASEADFLIADADDAIATASVGAHGRLRDTVFVGAEAPEGALARLPRPIDPLHILRELDLHLAARGVHTAVAAPGPMPVAVPAPAAPGGAGRDVLVVDDSAIARRFLGLRLVRLGYRVHFAQTGAEAIDAADLLAPALVFLDVVLGAGDALDGWQVCQQLKQRAPAPAVVLVTGLHAESDRVRARLAGCDAYLVKPLLEPEFIRTLRQVDPAFERRRVPRGRGSRRLLLNGPRPGRRQRAGPRRGSSSRRRSAPA